MRIRLDDGIDIDTTAFLYMGADVDRHDNVRVFVRRHGRKTRIRDWSSVAAFMAEYRALLSGSRDPAPRKGQPAAGSLRWLCERYYGAAEFLTLEDSTRQVRRRLLDRLCEAHGSKPVGQLEKRHVRDMRDAKVKAGTPEAAERGASSHALMAIFGWTTIKQAERYTRAADQQRLADEHMALIVPLSEPVAAGGTTRGKKAL